MGLKFLATKGLGLLGKSKTKTLDAVEPTLGRKGTVNFKFEMANKRLSKNVNEMVKFRNEKSKQMLKKQRGEK